MENPSRNRAFRIRLILVLALAAMLSGCGGATYTMHLDAYAEHVPYGKRFVVLQGVMDVKPDDPKFATVAAELAKAVEAKGYSKAPNVEQADLALYLAYHVTEHTHAPFENFSSGPAGPNPRRMLFMEYTRDVVVEAVDLARYKAGDPKNVVWKIHVASRGPIQTMEKSMPYIAAAVAQYMGTSGESYLEVDDSMNIKPYKPAKHHQRP